MKDQDSSYRTMTFCTIALLCSVFLGSSAAPTNLSSPFKHDNDSEQGPLSDVKLQVESAQPSVFAVRGGNATLSCRFWYKAEQSSPKKVWFRWFRLSADGEKKTLIVKASRSRIRSYGDLRGRVQLRQDSPGDATLEITKLQLMDSGYYLCEVDDGLEKKSTAVHLELQGVVFFYQQPHGLNFMEAKQACKEKGSRLATFTQLIRSWRVGLDCCSAGWLADGTVGHLCLVIWRYDGKDQNLDRYGAFCFSPAN